MVNVVHFVIEKGNKGPEDRVIKIWAYGEVISLADVLEILDVIFKSEDSYYPINEGKQGRAMLLKAIIDVYSGIPLERVLKFYKLERKAKPLKIIDKSDSQTFHEAPKTSTQKEWKGADFL